VHTLTKLTEKEIGYICGLMDGEGCSYMNKHGYHRHMKDGTIQLFFYHKIGIEMYNKKIMDWLHKKLNQIGIKHGYHHDNKRNSDSIHIRTEKDVDKFWDNFNRMKRLEPFENYIGCIIDKEKNQTIELSESTKKVFNALKEKQQPTGPTELSKILHKSLSTIAEHLNHLIEVNLIKKEGKGPQTKYSIKE